jgi:hypothetical protein
MIDKFSKKEEEMQSLNDRKILLGDRVHPNEYINHHLKMKWGLGGEI